MKEKSKQIENELQSEHENDKEKPKEIKDKAVSKKYIKKLRTSSDAFKEDKFVFSGTLAISVIAVIQFLQLTVLDIPLTVSLYSFAISIPFSSMVIFLHTILEHLKFTVERKYFTIGGYLGMFTAFIGLVGVFCHFSLIAGIVFFATSIVATVFWGLFKDSVMEANHEIFMAVSDHDAIRVKQLLAGDEDLEASPYMNWTPLMLAAANRNAVITKFLLEKGANPNVISFKGLTPLMFAARYGDEKLVKILLEAEADCDLCGDASSNPNALTVAAIEGHQSIVKLLLDAGADPTFQGPDGKTAEQFAQEAGHKEIVILLQKAIEKEKSGPDPSAPVHSPLDKA